MSNKIENAIILANIIEVVQTTINKIGFEHQAPIEPEQLTECVSSSLNNYIKNLGDK